MVDDKDLIIWAFGKEYTKKDKTTEVLKKFNVLPDKHVE